MHGAEPLRQLRGREGDRGEEQDEEDQHLADQLRERRLHAHGDRIAHGRGHHRHQQRGADQHRPVRGQFQPVPPHADQHPDHQSGQRHPGPDKQLGEQQQRSRHRQGAQVLEGPVGAAARHALRHDHQPDGEQEDGRCAGREEEGGLRRHAGDEEAEADHDPRRHQRLQDDHQREQGAGLRRLPPEQAGEGDDAAGRRRSVGGHERVRGRGGGLHGGRELAVRHEGPPRRDRCPQGRARCGRDTRPRGWRGRGSSPRSRAPPAEPVPRPLLRRRPARRS